VYGWLPGERAAASRIRDGARFARDLAAFVAALHAIDATGAPPPGAHNFSRGVPLAERDEATRNAIAALRGRIDHAAALRIWEAAMAAPAWSGPPVWIHGDLDRQNLLVSDGRLSGVIDFGGLGAGDPACDLMAAWKVFDRPERRLFRELIGADGASWERGRGWACSQAVIALAYYTDESHPVLVRESTAWLAALADA
jgi:aminoglycoside phosphotransferase (APT) family kinase protein